MKTAHGAAIPRSSWVPSGTSGIAGFGGEDARDQDGLVERPAQPFQPADQIDGGADRREIQPIGSTDIAPEHLAEMQRGAEAQRRQSLLTSRLIEMRHAGPRRGDRTQRRVAGTAGRSSGDREDRQHAVADEFQDFATERVDRTRDAVEPGIEGGDDAAGGLTSDSAVKPRRSA